jgi:enoyl-CoA hydratase
MLATDLRVVARSAKIISGFSRVGLSPGGGHFMLIDRVAGREAAAGLAMFDQEISGQRAYELGIAWAAVEDADVEETALRIAGRIANDPQLARRVVAIMRTELGPPAMPWEAAVELERSTQMWSMRRLDPRT